MKIAIFITVLILGVWFITGARTPNENKGSYWHNRLCNLKRLSLIEWVVIAAGSSLMTAAVVKWI